MFIRGKKQHVRDEEDRIADVKPTCREERWKSEGIQIGGVRSSRGVLGHWFDKYVSFLPSSSATLQFFILYFTSV